MNTWRKEQILESYIPHTTIYRKFCNDIFKCYEIYPDEGYVLYNSIAYDTECDPVTNEEYPITHYCTWVTCPHTIDLSKCIWRAESLDSLSQHHTIDGQ